MAKFKPSTVCWWVSVYKQEPSEKRSKEERHVICEDLYLRAGLHKATAGSAPSMSTSASMSMPMSMLCQAEHPRLAQSCSWGRLQGDNCSAHKWFFCSCGQTSVAESLTVEARFRSQNLDTVSLLVSLCVSDQWLSFQGRLWHWQSDGNQFLPDA